MKKLKCFSPIHSFRKFQSHIYHCPLFNQANISHFLCTDCEPQVVRTSFRELLKQVSELERFCSCVGSMHLLRDEVWAQKSLVEKKWPLSTNQSNIQSQEIMLRITAQGLTSSTNEYSTSHQIVILAVNSALLCHESWAYNLLIK